MAMGFLYLVVIMDWVSRAVLAWRLSNTLGVEALEEALSRYRRPEVLKQQIAQLPSRGYVSRLTLLYGASVWALIGLVALLFAG
jgi:putative transposase